MNNPDAYNNGYTANATQPIGQDGPSGGQPQGNRHDDTDGIPDGFSFNWIGAALLAAILLQINADYYFYMVLAAAVLIHEVGHFAMAKAFKCGIKRVQVFFISILTFKPKDTFRDGHLRRRTAWTVGALPFGGFTEFHMNSSPIKLGLNKPK